MSVVAAISSGTWAVQLMPTEKPTLSFDSAEIASSRGDVPVLCDLVHSRVIGRRSTLTRRTVPTYLPERGR